MVMLVAVVLAAGAAEPLLAGEDGSAVDVRVAIVADFVSEEGRLGEQLADSLRLRLRRHDDYDVIDRITTQELTGPLPADTPQPALAELMGQAGATAVVCGSVTSADGVVTADVSLLDGTDPRAPASWRRTFSDDTQRAHGLIARQVVEAIRSEAEWAPPEYGDEAEPANFAEPLNANGSFDDGAAGWDAADNVATFIEDGPDGRGQVLRIRTDLAREPWLAYRRELRAGKADVADPPEIAADSSYDSLAAAEGVHFAGEWIPATAGMRYWLVADCSATSSGIFFPKVFVKGFIDGADQADALPEQSLDERGLSLDDFAAMPPDERAELIAADAEAHPERYRRECYRWYLACRNESGKWLHTAAPFPPRGGLPENVDWLQIQIYCYWPAGEYLWDNVYLYADPAQEAPLPEEPARTPGREDQPADE
jgi:hypothetical protein